MNIGWSFRSDRGLSRWVWRTALVGVVTIGLVASVTAMVMPTASAEERPNTAADCQDDVGHLDRCDFVRVSEKQVEDAPKKISGTLDNCLSPIDNSIMVDYAYSSALTINSESGTVSTGNALLGSVSSVGLLLVQLGFSISGKTTTDSLRGMIKAMIPKGSRGWIMFAPYKVDAAGWYDAWYEYKVSGHFNWYWHHKGDTSVHVYYPVTLPKTNIPDGRAWVHTEPCTTGGGHSPDMALSSTVPAADQPITLPWR